MRKIIVNLAVTLDGYIEGPNGEYDWCLADQDYGMTEFFNRIDTIFIGRKSFELIAGTEDEMFPGVQLYVFSDTLADVNSTRTQIVKKADWENTVRHILEQDGKDIWFFGGAELLHLFLEQRLISELVLSVHPLLLGSGKQLFIKQQHRTELILANTQTYSSGLVQLTYLLKPVFDTSVLDSQIDELDKQIY